MPITYVYTKGIASYYVCMHAATVHKSRVFDRCMHVVQLFICNDLKCIDCKNYLQCSPINNFRRIGHQQKFIDVKNKCMKYSHNLIWATYGMLVAICS